MKDLTNRLVVVLLLIVVISTIITTVAFFQIEKKAFLARARSATPSDTGMVSIKIDDGTEPELAVGNTVSSGSAQVGITINEKED